MAQLNNLLVTGSAKFLNTVTGNIDGNASTATSATKATQDESGNNIKATYAASASISGNTVTLKNKNGGTLSTVTIPSELPAVSSSDNDKVLTVVNGSWTAASSGGGTLEVTFTNGSAVYSKTSSHSASEIYEAVQNGYTVFGTYGDRRLELVYSSASSAKFCQVEDATGSPIALLLTSLLLSGASSKTAILSTRKTTNYEKESQVFYILVACDDDPTYNPNPTGTMSVMDSQLEDIVELYNLSTADRNMAVKVAYGMYYSFDPDYGYEVYDMVSAFPSYNTGDDQWYITATFRVLSEKNGTPVIKTIVLYGPAWSYEYLDDVEVTYSETVINTNRTASITFAAANWTGNGPYTQTVTISGATISSDTKVDLQPDATAITQMLSDGVMALYIDNNSGTLTATAVGAAPTANMTIQCTY